MSNECGNGIISKAKSRLRSAARSLSSLESSTDIDAFREHWYPFLAAWKGVLNIVEQGVKGNAPAVVWFNAKKQQRKDDGLLTYLFHARNDEEHGLVPTVDHTGTQMLVAIPDVDVADRRIDFRTNRQTGMTELYRSDGGPMTVIQEHLDGPTLRVVKDRGVEYSPPIAHLGEIIDIRPLPIAIAGLRWMEKLVEEAEEHLN